MSCDAGKAVFGAASVGAVDGSVEGSVAGLVVTIGPEDMIGFVFGVWV